MFMLVPIVKFRLIIFTTRVDFERVLTRCRSHMTKNYRAQHRDMDGAQHQIVVPPPYNTRMSVMSGLLTPGWIFLF